MLILSSLISRAVHVGHVKCSYIFRYTTKFVIDITIIYTHAQNVLVPVSVPLSPVCRWVDDDDDDDGDGNDVDVCVCACVFIRF